MTDISVTTEVSGAYDAEIDQFFAADGTLASGIAGFRPRQSQTDMARAVAQAIATQDTLLAEAGTGTGKTFAYLVPALLWGGKVIVSTGTKNLQDQLFLRDIPVVRKALILHRNRVPEAVEWLLMHDS